MPNLDQIARRLSDGVVCAIIDEFKNSSKPAGLSVEQFRLLKIKALRAASSALAAAARDVEEAKPT